MTSAPPETSGEASVRPPISHLVGAILLDAALVTAFAATGRATHGEDALAGLWQTAWPFLGGLVIGWLATRAWRAPAAPLRTGLGVWAATIVVGMLLRAVSGQGTALPFVIVATVVLFAALVGWRAIAALVARRRR
nr:DUF3054 domain-containing protein [Agromyces agglutinans]